MVSIQHDFTDGVNAVSLGSRIRQTVDIQPARPLRRLDNLQPVIHGIIAVLRSRRILHRPVGEVMITLAAFLRGTASGSIQIDSCRCEEPGSQICQIHIAAHHYGGEVILGIGIFSGIHHITVHPVSIAVRQAAKRHCRTTVQIG